MPSFRFSLGLWMIFAVLVLTTGCVRLEKTYPQKKAYALATPSTVARQTPLSDRVLQIDSFNSAPAYRDRGFVYRTGDQTWQSDYYHEFFTPPVAMFSEIIRDWLQKTGLFGQISQAGYPTASDLLQGRIVALHGDYRPGRTPMAVLELQLSLTDLQTTPPRNLFHRSYRRSLPLADKQPTTLVQTWNTALADILQEFEEHLQKNLHPDTSSAKGSPSPIK